MPTCPSRRNIWKFLQYSPVQSVTNSPVITWAPACEVLKEKKVEGRSNKQAYQELLLVNVVVGILWIFGVLGVTYSSASKGKAVLNCLVYLTIIGGLAFFTYPPILGLSALLAIVVAPLVILAMDNPLMNRIIRGISVVIFIAALVGWKLVGSDRFAYLDDYSFPEYLTSSTSTNIVVVHEKIDLPHKNVYKSINAILYRDRRIRTVSTNELAALLQAQAEEIHLFRQATQPQDKD